MPETVEQKEEKQGPPSPLSLPARPERFRRLVSGGIVVAALCWGATLTYALSGVEVMGSAIGELSSLAPPGQAPRAAGRPIALALGAAAAAALAWAGVSKFRSRLEWFKPGQGRWVRVCAFGGLAAMVGFGCVAFYKLPETTSLWWADLWQRPIFGKVLAVKPILFPSLAIFGTVLFATFLLLNRAKWGDFLIETEGELKKVSWPPRKEYVGSAFVVVIVVVVISMFLHVADLGLTKLMIQLGIGF